jgi:hypothetical protein
LKYFGSNRAVFALFRAHFLVVLTGPNHSPYFAPIIHPTVETGVETLVVTALAWLGK